LTHATLTKELTAEQRIRVLALDFVALFLDDLEQSDVVPMILAVSKALQTVETFPLPKAVE
jgi:hypothetical protein